MRLLSGGLFSFSKMVSTSHEIPENLINNNDDDLHEAAFSRRRCCFCLPCFGSKRSSTGDSIWWERISTGENKTPVEDPGYLRAWKRVREWSELVAGPRWKTFIRTFRKNWTGPTRQSKYQYDPLSYALNFDDGSGQMDGNFIACDFSSRYAAVPASVKPSTKGTVGCHDSRDSPST